MRGQPCGLHNLALTPGRRAVPGLRYSLPAAPAGRTYQLWVLTARPAPTSAGLLKPDSNGRVSAVFATPSDLPNPVAMAVTLEPEGGVLSPTGDKFLVGLAQ